MLVFSFWTPIGVRPLNPAGNPDLVFRGVFRGEQGGHGPQSSIEWIFTEKKPALLGLFSLPEVFCGPQICQKCGGRRGSARTPARPPSWLGERDTPSPIPTPLGAFGASILAPSALSFCGPQCKILTPLLVLFTVLNL